MGCCSSIFACETDKINSSLNDHYVATSVHRRISKRNYTSHVSTGSSSGVSSGCTSPSRSTKLSRSSPSTLSNSETLIPKAKTCNFKIKRKRYPNAFEMLSICDDFREAAEVNENNSCGYYSESMSNESSVSTPTQSCLRRTQDTSNLLKSPSKTIILSPTDLNMEMYMMARSPGLMPKTSSPLLHRRDITLNAAETTSLATHSYHKWVNYLKDTPTYMLHNVTNIPEALAGHFSPLNFPAFTALEVMESAPKRFKIDTCLTNENKRNFAHIMITDL